MSQETAGVGGVRKIQPLLMICEEQGEAYSEIQHWFALRALWFFTEALEYYGLLSLYSPVHPVIPHCQPCILATVREHP